MNYATDADGDWKGMDSNEAQVVTFLSPTDHKNKNKASTATTHHGNAHDNRSPRWKEGDRTEGGVTLEEYKGTKMKESREEMVHHQGKTITPLGRGAKRVPTKNHKCHNRQGSQILAKIERPQAKGTSAM